MENALVSLILIAVAIVGILTIFQIQLSSQDTIIQDWQKMNERMEEQQRTQITAISASVENMGATVAVTLENDGSIKVADYEKWDVILQYNNGAQVSWYPYGNGQNEWTKMIVDVMETEIFNPGEEMTIHISVWPFVENGSNNMVTIACPNGSTATTVFTY